MTKTQMTEQHPLTDEICEELADTEDRPYAFRYCRLTYIEMINMRAAADWQLEQVVEWIAENVAAGYLIAESLKAAMRPITLEDN